MGSAPEEPLLEEIRTAALSAAGVMGVNTVRAHYVGHFIHVEVHIEVGKELSTLESHRIGESATSEIESLGAIEKAFIHIDPI